MRKPGLLLAISTLAICGVRAQVPAEPSVERTLQFNLNQSPESFLESVTAVRAIADVRTGTPDQAHRTVTAQGTQMWLAVADWLVGQLNQPTAAQPPSGPTEYRFSGDPDNVVRIFYLGQSKSRQDILELSTAVRSLADIRRMVPYLAANAVILRGNATQVALAQWLFEELLPRAAAPPAGRDPFAGLDRGAPTSYDYVSQSRADQNEHAVRIFRFDTKLPPADFLQFATAIRSIAEVRRAYPTTDKVLIARGTPEQIDTAEWLYKKLDPQWQLIPPGSPMSSTNPYYPVPAIDDGVRIYWRRDGTEQQFLDAVTQVHTALNGAKVYPAVAARAVVVRGKLSQLDQAVSLVMR